MAEVGSGDVPIAALVDYEVKLVKEFGNDPAVIGIEIMNEPHDLSIGATGWANAAQQVIDGIRQVNSSIYIFVDGYAWASAGDWPGQNPTLQNLKDPSDRIVFTAHAYFDRSNAGVYQGAEATAPLDTNYDFGSQRITPFIDWLKTYGLQNHGGMTEFGTPNTAKWAELARRMLITSKAAGLSMSAHMDLPGDNDPYVMNLYPPSGQGDRYIEHFLQSLAKKTSDLNTPVQ
jgi:endoglucanase